MVYSHHPTPAGFDPRHAPQLELWRRAQALLPDGRNGDSGRVGLIKSDCLVIMEGTDLPVGPIGYVWQVLLTIGITGLDLWRQLVNTVFCCFEHRLRLVLRCRHQRQTQGMMIFHSFISKEVMGSIAAANEQV